MNFHRKQIGQSCFTSLLKRDLFKRTEFAPHGSKFFPFRVDPFSERTKRSGKLKESNKSCHSCQKLAIKLSSVSIYCDYRWHGYHD